MGDRTITRATAAIALVVVSLMLGVARIVAGGVGVDGTALVAVVCMVGAVLVAAPWLGSDQ